MSRDWRQEYLARVRALHGDDDRRRRVAVSGPLRGGDCPETHGGLLARLAVENSAILAAILLEAKYLTVKRLVDEATERLQEQCDVRANFRRAFESTFADDEPWRRWVQACFPLVTRLPIASAVNGRSSAPASYRMTSWHELAKRIIRLVCTTRMRLGDVTHECFAPVVRWRSFQDAFADATDGVRFFVGHNYRRTYYRTLPKRWRGTAYPLQPFALVIGSEQYTSLYRRRGPLRTLHSIVADLSQGEGSRMEDVADSFDDSETDDDRNHGFACEVWVTVQRAARALPPFASIPVGPFIPRSRPPEPVVMLQTWLEPRLFVSDRLFATIADRRATDVPPPPDEPGTTKLLEQLFSQQ